MNFTRIFSYFFTRMYPYVSRMYPYVTRMCPYVPYVTRMLLVCYSYVLVWCFSHDLLFTRINLAPIRFISSWSL